jgi:hypothetical protein
MFWLAVRPLNFLSENRRPPNLPRPGALDLAELRFERVIISEPVFHIDAMDNSPIDPRPGPVPLNRSSIEGSKGFDFSFPRSALLDQDRGFSHRADAERPRRASTTQSVGTRNRFRVPCPASRTRVCDFALARRAKSHEVGMVLRPTRESNAAASHGEKQRRRTPEQQSRCPNRRPDTEKPGMPVRKT